MLCYHDKLLLVPKVYSIRNGGFDHSTIILTDMLSLNCDYIPCVLDRLILAIPLLLLVYVTSCCTAVLLKTIRIMILYFDILRPLTSDVGPLYFFNAVICFIIQEK